MTSKNGSPNYFITQTNPEIFEVIPRPGGLLKIDIPAKPNRIQKNAAKAKELSKSSVNVNQRASRTNRLKAAPSQSVAKTKSTTTTPSRKSLLTVTSTRAEAKSLDADSCPREYKVRKIIAATPWSVEFDEYLEPTEESKRIPDPFQDSVDMLAMSISVIMLLARGYGNITESHFKWIYSYLDCIRDAFGNIPPNVQGILNYITEVTGGKVSSFLYDDVEPVELKNGSPEKDPEQAAESAKQSKNPFRNFPRIST